MPAFVLRPLDQSSTLCSQRIEILYQSAAYAYVRVAYTIHRATFALVIDGAPWLVARFWLNRFHRSQHVAPPLLQHEMRA